MVKKNLLELVDRIVALNGRGVDGLVVGLLRQIRAGDHGRENSDLCTALLTMIKGNRYSNCVHKMGFSLILENGFMGSPDLFLFSFTLLRDLLQRKALTRRC